MQRKSLNSSPFIKQRWAKSSSFACHGAKKYPLPSVFIGINLHTTSVCTFHKYCSFWDFVAMKGNWNYFDVYTHGGVSLGSLMHLLGRLHRSDSYIFHLNELCTLLAHCGFFWLQLNKTLLLKGNLFHWTLPCLIHCSISMHPLGWSHLRAVWIQRLRSLSRDLSHTVCLCSFVTERLLIQKCSSLWQRLSTLSL